MERIKNEQTALSTMGLNLDLIMQGECLEFDEEKKFKRGERYTKLDLVTPVIDLYSKDLRQAYATIEEMEGEIAEMKATLDQVTAAAQKSAQQVKQVLSGERKFTEAETKLAELMASVEQLRQSHADDGALIAQLRQQIKDAQDLAATVPEMAQDVQYVLDGLERSLRERGLDLDAILQGA